MSTPTGHSPVFLASMPAPDAPLQTWAHYYASLGWPVFPCRGKEPMPGSHGFHDATTDPFQIDIWWRQTPDANIGAPAGLTWWALDVDPRHCGDSTLFTLQHQYGWLPHTTLSHTGGGGDHYLWQMPAGGIVNKAKLGEGLDVQGLGSYIILPPSVHPETGKPYIWDLVDSPEDVMPVPAPDWLLHLVSPAAGSTPKPTPAPDTPILQGERDNTLTQYAISMAHAGIGEAAIRAALDVLNTRCQPPLHGSDLDRIAHSASRYLRPVMVTAPGAPAPSTNGAPPAPAQGWGTPFDLSAGISSRELSKSMFVPARFLVDRMIPDGLAILAAPAKSYKSYFALSLALATIGDGDWCDSFPVNSTGPVVFFGLESSRQQLRNRIFQLRPQHNPAAFPYAIEFYSGMRSIPSFRHGLEDALKRVMDEFHPRLIVVDPLSYLYRLGRQDDLASATLDLLWPLADLMAEAGIALLALEHLRKRSKEDVSLVDQLAGSHIKAAVVQALLVIRRAGAELEIDTTMRDAASQQLVMNIEFSADGRRVLWGYRGSQETVSQGRTESLRALAYHELRSRRHPMRVTELIEALGVPNTEATKANLRQILNRGEKDGELAVSRRGEYYWIEQNKI